MRNGINRRALLIDPTSFFFILIRSSHGKLTIAYCGTYGLAKKSLLKVVIQYLRLIVLLSFYYMLFFFVLNRASRKTIRLLLFSPFSFSVSRIVFSRVGTRSGGRRIASICSRKFNLCGIPAEELVNGDY